MADKIQKHNSSLRGLVLFLALLVLMSMAFVGVTFQRLSDNSEHERTWVALATEAQVDSQRLSKSAAEAALGNLEAFAELSETHARMDLSMSNLALGSSELSLPPVPTDVNYEMTRLDQTWARLSENTGRITSREQLLNELAAASLTFQGAIPDIQASMDRVVRQLIESGATNPQVFAASRQLVLTDRMLRHESELRKGGSNAVKAAEELRNEVALFDQQHRALLQGNSRMGVTPVRNQQALNTLAQVRRQFERARPQVQSILDSSSDLFEVRGAADEIFLDSQEMFNRANALANAIASLPHSRTWPSVRSGSIGLVVMIGLLAVMLAFFIAGERRRAEVAANTSRKAQKAILRLLDELSSLADGDLTVQATVSDEITGAIADAVNYAVEQLRELVAGINRTAIAVAESSQSTSQATSQLASASEEQAGQVTRATEKIQSMANSFNSMAGRSRDSSEAAMESVAIAHAGAEKVRETIAGMDVIREQIQETSKRIKRLGESTQEIGDIVSMIKDIAEQTNVLALNAAIQAASSGGSGKGFAMVADEVQQLAESATNATRRISSLVQTIQVDTAEAVASMETTTSEVVNGARLAQEAGKALLQIEEVSNDLNGLIQDISNEASEQSENAQRISELMDGIRSVSVKTSQGSSSTADAVAELAELVAQLKESVSDFKLPEER